MDNTIAIVGSNILIAMASIGSTITLFLWARSEAREDLASYRRETNDILKSIQLEMKDFHEKLIKIEMEKNNNCKK